MMSGILQRIVKRLIYGIVLGTVFFLIFYAIGSLHLLQKTRTKDFVIVANKRSNSATNNSTKQDLRSDVLEFNSKKYSEADDPRTFKLPNLDFKVRVEKVAAQEKTIFLSIVDSAYVEMAINLYATSYAALAISNYLFIGTDKTSCKLMSSQKVVNLQMPIEPPSCYTYFKDPDGKTSSVYGSQSFKRKTHYKTNIVLDVLRLGLNVVIVDVDIVLFKNPLPYFTCTSCDIEIQNDSGEGNSGFYIARPTSAAIWLHEQALEVGLNSNVSNQKALAMVMDSMFLSGKLKNLTLSDAQFPCGQSYYEDGRVMFRDDINCTDCVMVHNNFILGNAAKKYRFKETGMWMVDNDDYYSNPQRKYISYENPIDFGPGNTLTEETSALRAAMLLGYLLNRTVILPSFSCYGCGGYGACNNTRGRCALNAFYTISAFDDHFAGAYREHEFLRHPAVPEKVLSSQSPVMLIKSRLAKNIQVTKDVVMVEMRPIRKLLLDKHKKSEILAWFSQVKSYSVLRFHSLYGIIGSKMRYAKPDKSNRGGYEHLESNISNAHAFLRTQYRQY